MVYVHEHKNTTNAYFSIQSSQWDLQRMYVLGINNRKIKQFKTQFI